MIFEQWFNELEGYATRAERFYEDVQLQDFKRMKEWLRAAYNVGCKNTEHTPDINQLTVCSKCGISFEGVTSYYCSRSDCNLFVRIR